MQLLRLLIQYLWPTRLAIHGALLLGHNVVRLSVLGAAALAGLTGASSLAF